MIPHYFISLLLLCFTVNPISGQISNLILINADTSSPILNISNGTIINMAMVMTSNFNVQAETTTTEIKSVCFGFNGVTSCHVELSPPFALCGDSQGSGVYNTCQTLKVGNHTVSATPYFGTKASGVAGIHVQVQFSIINETFTKSPTIAPMTVITNSPMNAPMMVITTSPTKVPMMFFTTSPMKAPMLDTMKSPTKVPSPDIMKSPTMAPLTFTTKSPTNAPMMLVTTTPTKVPMAIITKSPTNAPTMMVNCTIPRL